MSSTFAAIELGKRSLVAHNQGIRTVGNNLANASTEGYSRQRVEMKAMPALYEPHLNREERPGQVGQGVTVASVTRVRDEILETRIVAQSGAEGYWTARDRYILDLERIHNEPSDLSIRSRLDKFWEGWQELSLNPNQESHRTAVLERGNSLMDAVNSKFKALSQVRQMINEDVSVTVGEANQYMADIASLNTQIEKVKAMGDNPNDLYDRRDLLAEKLADIVPVTIENKRDPDEYQIHVGGYHLVQGKLSHPMKLEGNPNNEGLWDVIRSDNGEKAFLPGGKLGALLELRDGDTKEEIQKLDNMTMHFVDLVNEIHSSAYGLDGSTGVNFFNEYPFVNRIDGAYDRNGDGALDSTLLFRVQGQYTLNPQEQIGLAGTMTFGGPGENVSIEYFPTDTVQDVINRINHSGAEISARLDREGRMSLKAVPTTQENVPDFVIRRIEDSGQFLAGYTGVLAASGPDGAFDWENPQAVAALGANGNYAVAPLSHPSGWVRVNEALLTEPNKLAAGFGNQGLKAETGDGTAALAIAAVRNSPVMIGKTRTFDDFFATTVAEIGLKGETAQISLETQQKIMKDLRDMRESISGVNMDEEFAQLIKFQHGYNAAARFVSEADKMLDTIINRMGV